jgi:hypothetical protein
MRRGNPMEAPKTGKPHGASAQCGAATRSGGRCNNAAGWGTDHPGSGRCKLHGGKGGRPVTTGNYSRYSVIRSQAAAALREHFEADPDPLNLVPDVLELRVRIAEFCNRYDETTEALLAWHASFSPPFSEAMQAYYTAAHQWQADYTAWKAEWESYREAVEATQGHYRLGWPEPPPLSAFPEPPLPPEPLHFEGKPRRVIDILSASRFLGEIGAMVERIRRSDMERGISLIDVNAILKRHAEELLAAASETLSDERTRNAFLDAVAARWDAVPIAVDRTRYHGGQRP